MIYLEEFAKAYAKKRAVTKVEAMSMIKDFLSLLEEKVDEEGGVCFKGEFSIEKKIRNSRRVVWEGKEYQSKERYVAKFRCGKNFENLLNKA